MGEISYRPLIEAMTWSYSRLEIFDDCPYRWFLTYIHTPKLKKEDKFYATYGLFMHDLLEKYFKGENSKEEILMMFLTQFKAKTKGTGRPKAATVQKYFQSGTEFIKSLEPLRFKMISVEEKIDFKIGEFNFTGRIDYLGEEDGEFVIIDNKSRDLKPRSGRAKPTLKDKELDLMLRQLYIYAEAVRQKYGNCRNYYVLTVLGLECLSKNRLTKTHIAKTYHGRSTKSKRYQAQMNSILIGNFSRVITFVVSAIIAVTT